MGEWESSEALKSVRSTVLQWESGSPDSYREGEWESRGDEVRGKKNTTHKNSLNYEKQINDSCIYISNYSLRCT